jgi:hypothetical protein
MALIAVKDASITTWVHEYNDDGDRIIVSGTNFTFTSGFIYVIRPDRFIEIKNDQGRKDIVSYEPVVPQECICVTSDILKYLNVRIIDSRHSQSNVMTVRREAQAYGAFRANQIAA